MRGLSKISEGGKKIASTISKHGKKIWWAVILSTAAIATSGPQIVKNFNVGGTFAVEDIFHQFVNEKFSSEGIEKNRELVEIHFKWTPHIPVLVSEQNSADARVIYVPEHATQDIFLHKLPIEQRSKDATKWRLNGKTFYGYEIINGQVVAGFEIKRSLFDEGIDSDGTSDADDWNVVWVQSYKPYVVLGLKAKNNQVISFVNQKYNKWGSSEWFEKTPDANQVINAAWETTTGVISRVSNTVSNFTSNITPNSTTPSNEKPENTNTNEVILEPTN